MDTTLPTLLARDRVAPTAKVRQSRSEVVLKKAPARKKPVLAHATMNQLPSEMSDTNPWMYQRFLRSSSTTAVTRKRPVVDLTDSVWSKESFEPRTPSQIPKSLLFRGQKDMVSNFRSTTGFEKKSTSTKMFPARPCNTFDVDDPFAESLDSKSKPSRTSISHRMNATTAIKQPAHLLSSSVGFKQRRQGSRGSCQVAIELNCPLDTTMDARGLFDRYAINGNLDYKKFGEIVVQIMKSTKQQLTEEGMKTKIEASWREADRNFNGQVSFDEFAIWYSSWGFQKELLLSPTKIRRRNFAEDFARMHELDLADVEAVYTKFQQFDEDGSGEIEYTEFVSLLYKLVKVPKGAELPANRLNHFWKEIDIDGSGSVCADEFLRWYIKYFDLKGNSSVSPVEHFYQSVRPNLGR